MIRRTLVLAPLVATALGIAACSGGGTPTTPASPSASQIPAASDVALYADSALGGVFQSGDLTQGALAIYTFEIDPATLTATSHLKEVRAGQENDDLFMLSLSPFFQAPSLKISSVTTTPTTLDLGYVVAHPFPKPANLDGATHFLTNRADLGVAGMTLFLADADATGNTYFTNRIANTAIITNADGYFSPAGLVALSPSVTANTFPYRQLVDELVSGTGNRVLISNGGDITGNYGSDGWGRADMTPNRDNWSGYGILHQGQSATNSVSFDLTQLTTSFSLDVAVIVKYNDPRGGDTVTQKKANRLPPADPPSHLKLMYRMPHGALDVGRIIVQPQVGDFLTGEISAANLNFRVEDWDAEANPTGDSDLHFDEVPTNVNASEIGAPSVDVCIPGVLGLANDVTTIAAIANIPGPDTGEPGSELYFSATVTKSATDAGVDGPYTGMVRATDVEAALLDPPFTSLNETLAPAAVPAKPITYQVFTTALENSNVPPTLTVAAPGAPIASGDGVLTLTVDPYNDTEGDPISIGFDWNDDGDYDDAGEADQLLDGTAPDTFNSPIFYNNVDLVTDALNVNYQFKDDQHVGYQSGTVGFSVGANQPPQITAGTVTLLASSLTEPATFTLQNNGITAVDAENDFISYSVRCIPSVSAQQVSGVILEANLHGYNASPEMGPWMAADSPLIFRPYVNDASHPLISGPVTPPGPLNATVTVPCSLPTVGNVSLETLNGVTPRTAAAHNSAVTGVRVLWPNIPGEGAYAIYRGVWDPGTLVSSVSFTEVGEVGPDITGYDDNSIDVTQGIRYLYRVNARCVSGGVNGPDSELAMVALQNFEGASNSNALSVTELNGWLANYRSAGGTGATANEPLVLYYDNSALPANLYPTPPAPPVLLNGTRDLLAYEIGLTAGIHYITYSPPQLNDRAALGPLSSSIFEMVHVYSNGGSATSGYTILTNTGRPPNGLFVGPATPNNWRYHNPLAAPLYNDNQATTSMTNLSGTIGWYNNITTANGGGVVSSTTLFNWGNANPGGAVAKSLSRMDVSSGTLTGLPTPHDYVFVAMATDGNSAAASARERFRIDDLAWIVY